MFVSKYSVKSDTIAISARDCMLKILYVTDHNTGCAYRDDIFHKFIVSRGHNSEATLIDRVSKYLVFCSSRP